MILDSSVFQYRALADFLLGGFEKSVKSQPQVWSTFKRYAKRHGKLSPETAFNTGWPPILWVDRTMQSTTIQPVAGYNGFKAHRIRIAGTLAGLFHSDPTNADKRVLMEFVLLHEWLHYAGWYHGAGKAGRAKHRAFMLAMYGRRINTFGFNIS